MRGIFFKLPNLWWKKNSNIPTSKINILSTLVLFFPLHSVIRDATAILQMARPSETIPSYDTHFFWLRRYPPTHFFWFLFLFFVEISHPPLILFCFCFFIYLLLKLFLHSLSRLQLRYSHPTVFFSFVFNIFHWVYFSQKCLLNEFIPNTSYVWK